MAPPDALITLSITDVLSTNGRGRVVNLCWKQSEPSRWNEVLNLL